MHMRLVQQVRTLMFARLRPRVADAARSFRNAPRGWFVEHRSIRGGQALAAAASAMISALAAVTRPPGIDVSPA